MVNFLRKFSPNLSETTSKLRDLLKSDHWLWSDEDNEQFNAIKRLITAQPGRVLQYFKFSDPVYLEVDASKYGLGAVLFQNSGPIEYASRALSPTEQNYSLIEKEMLAVVFGCIRFHQYVYARSFTVFSDHLPLESIFKKPISSATPRLQKMMIKTQPYNLNVEFRPGKFIPVADFLSRNHLKQSGEPFIDVKSHVQMISKSWNIK